MSVIKARHRNFGESLLPAGLAFGVLGVAALILFPSYVSQFQKPNPHNGRTDYEALFQRALQIDRSGGKQNSAKMYTRIISATGHPSGCPNFYTLPLDSPHLKTMAYEAIGVMRSYHGHADTALAAFQEAARLEPQSAINQFYLGYGLEKAGRGVEAQQAYAKSSALGPVKLVYSGQDVGRK